MGIKDKTLSSYIDGHNNNFNLLRLLAATVVVLSHSFVLTYQDATGLIANIGSLAVCCFFTISGFLVCKSALSRRPISNFYFARALRIYPALCVAVLFCVILIGPLHTKLTVAEFFTNIETYSFLFKNVVLLFGVQTELPGVFVERGLEVHVNMPLWTLVFEVYLYIFIGLLVTALARKGTTRVFTASLILLTVLGLCLYGGNVRANFIDSAYINYSLLYSTMFGVGACFYQLRHRIVISGWILAASFILLVVAFDITGVRDIMFYLFLAYSVLFAAFRLNALNFFNRVGDYSYGVYIFTYPIQQSAAHWFKWLSPMGLFFISISLGLLLSIVSWHLLESRALKLKLDH